jgi:hypothetical protein
MMRRRTSYLLVVMLCVWVGSCLTSLTVTAVAAEREPPMLSHDVFFTLKEKSPEAAAKLTAACRKYLADHPGVVWFAAGPLADDLRREVNDVDFDVALHVVFKNKAAHDTYQTAEDHLKFIEENSESWSKVRVFDSYVAASTHGEVELQGDQPGRKREDGKRVSPEAKRAARKAAAETASPK